MMVAEIFGMDGVIVIVVAIVVLFGAKRLPEMARSIGRAQGEFKKGLKEGAIEDEPPTDESAKSSS
jgi:sec-independent protein translocase protein TatA